MHDKLINKFTWLPLENKILLSDSEKIVGDFHYDVR